MIKTKQDDPSVKEIVKQIEDTRNLDAETSKPRLQKAKTPSDTKTTEDPKKENANKSKSVPPEPQKSELQMILLPYLRYPVTGVPISVISKFVPSAFNMYYIIHLMDDVIRKNGYFKRQQDAWHPFVSRLYFGIIFIIQTVRAEISAGVASKARKNFYTKFARDYPPDTLPVPGPLATLFECLTHCHPSSSLAATVTPFIPLIVGPARADTLLNGTPATAHQLILPNIPLLLGLTSTVTNAAPAAIPDYSNPATFTNATDRTINGHVFTHEDWTDIEIFINYLINIILLKPCFYTPNLI